MLLGSLSRNALAWRESFLLLGPVGAGRRTHGRDVARTSGAATVSARGLLLRGPVF
jgi:hypothetical protein